MIIELYINDIRIDLYNPIPFSYTKQWNKLGSIADRQSSYTNKFTAPLTPKNIDTFNQLGITGNTSRIQYQNNAARLVVDGLTIVSNGYAHITELKTDFSITIYDDIIQFFKTLGTKKLSELDLTDLDHDLTTTNFTDSFSHDYTDGYIYALADFGNFDTSGIIINYQLPSFYVRYIWDLIHSEAGFIPDWHPDDTHIFSPKRGYDSEVDTGTASSITSSFTGVLEVDGCFDCYPVYLPRYNFLNFQPNETNGSITLDDGVFTVSESGVYHFDITLNSTTNYGIDINAVAVQMFLNGVLQTSYNLGTYTTPLTITPTHILNIGDSVEFRLYWGDFTESVLGLDFESDVDIDFYNVAGATGITVNLSTFIGEMTQSAFIKDIMQVYGLVQRKEKDSNNISYVLLKDLLRDRANSVDWSDKFTEVTGEQYQLSNFAQNNTLAYNYTDSDEVPYADGILEINNQTLAIDKTLLTRPYNASKKSESVMVAAYSGGTYNVLVQSLPFWEANRDDAGNITDWSVKSGKNYYGFVNVNNMSITYKTASGTAVTNTFDVPVFNFDGLKYADFLNENYQELKNVYDWNRNISASLRMDLYDFDKVSPFELVYIKQLSTYFYLNKIKLGTSTTIADLTEVKQNFQTFIFASAGRILNGITGSGDIVLDMDGSKSRNYDSASWTIETIPTGSVTPIIDDAKNIETFITILDNSINIGTYVLKLTLTNGSDTEESSVQFEIT